MGRDKKKEKIINIVAILSITLALFLVIFLTYFAIQSSKKDEKTTLEYETQLFDIDQVMSVNIIMDEDKWKDMLENATKEEYYSCDIEINGTTYKNVGIRPKGNTSLSQVASDDTTDRFSFKIEFDHYVDGQTCLGLDKICFNNIISDATYMKEYLSYDILNSIGVDTPLYSYVNISVNDENWGLYLAVESIEESFLERNYGTTSGKLYKPETMGMGGKERDNQKAEEKTNQENMAQRGDFGGDRGSSDANLSYIDDDISSYSTIFSSAVVKATKKDYKRVIRALKNISEGNLEEGMDVDAMLRYIAGNVIVLNDDSYFGNMLHNYYLYEQDGKLTMLPWDYNLAFGGFQGNNATSVINRGIDTVVSNESYLANRPMIAKVLEVEEYKEKYHAYLDELITNYFESGVYEEKIKEIGSLIDEYVKNDTTAFYTYEEYQTAKETLLQFGLLRAKSIRGQLEGTIPSTSSEQQNNQDVLVDASSINIRDMGSQGGGDKGGNKMQMENEQPPEMPQRGGENGQQPPEMSQQGEKMGVGRERSQKLASKNENGSAYMIMAAVSFGVMLIAIVGVVLYKRRKYRSK